MKTTLERFVACRSGASSVSYGFLAAAIGMGIVAALFMVSA